MARADILCAQNKPQISSAGRSLVLAVPREWLHLSEPNRRISHFSERIPRVVPLVQGSIALTNDARIRRRAELDWVRASVYSARSFEQV